MWYTCIKVFTIKFDLEYSTSWKVSAAYIIIRLSAHYIQDSIREIMMYCSKVNVKFEILLSTGRNEYQQYSHIFNHHLCIEQLAYLNYYIYIVFVVVFTLVGGLTLISAW